jgi:hypothetical protein
MSGTPRLALPFLSAGQAQKEFFHNEALQILDMVVAAAVEEEPRDVPPDSSAQGICFIVGSSPTGAWAGKVHNLACYTSGGWRFLPPIEGMCVYVKATSVWATYRAGAWETGVVRGSSLVLGGQQVVGGRLVGIASPAGGATVDTQARDAIHNILVALREHGLIDA